MILEETQTQCYAWALIPNHFHLLLRTGPTSLSQVMRRLMTGYAVTFNIRHRRSGHLFQNRYKSVICEEDPYLLELIRYIHLNSLRAKLVQDVKELDKYPWTGHSAILGKRKNPLISSPPSNKKGEKPEKSLAEKTIEDVLLHFGDKLGEARKRYRQFVKNGIEQGTHPEFQGGGLVRSAGGNKAGILGRKKEEMEKGDARILGSGDFVSRILREGDKTLERKYLYKRSIQELIEFVATQKGIAPEVICSGSRKPMISDARSIVAYMAVEETGYAATDVARYLGIMQTSVLQSVSKGRILCAGIRQEA